MVTHVLDHVSMVMDMYYQPRSRSEDIASDLERRRQALRCCNSPGEEIACGLPIAVEFLQLRRSAEASALLARTMELARRQWGEDHPEVIRLLLMCALAKLFSGKDDDACLLLRQARAAVGSIDSDLSGRALLWLQVLALEVIARSSTLELNGNAECRIAMMARLNRDQRSTLVEWINCTAIFAKNTLGRFDASHRLFEWAIEMQPDNSRIHANHGTLLWTCMDRVDESEELYRKALATHRDPGVLSSLALLLTHERGDLAGAAALYEEAATLASGEDIVNLSGNYITLAALQGDLDLIGRLLERGVSNAPYPRSRMLLRLTYCRIVLAALQSSDFTALLPVFHAMLKDPLVARVRWPIKRLREHLTRHLPGATSGLLVALSDAVNSRQNEAQLDNHAVWRDAIVNG